MGIFVSDMQLSLKCPYAVEGMLFLDTIIATTYNIFLLSMLTSVSKWAKARAFENFE